MSCVEPHLSVIIPTHEKTSRLRLCLQALNDAVCRSEEPLPIEVLVVDDASGDNTLGVLKRGMALLPIPTRIIRHCERGGRSVARNAGAERAQGARLLFLDDDIVVDADVLRWHLAQNNLPAPSLARASILHLPWLRATDDLAHPPKSLPPEVRYRIASVIESDRLIDQLRPLARRSAFESDIHGLLDARPSGPGRWPAATGGNLSIPRSTFVQLGGFDPNLGRRWGLEDLELGYRAEQHGVCLRHTTEQVVFHLDHPVPDRRADHAAALQYVTEKHGAKVGDSLRAYFEEDAPLTVVDAADANEAVSTPMPKQFRRTRASAEQS